LHKQIYTYTALLYEKYERLKNNYLYQLAQLLNTFDVKVELPDQAARSATTPRWILIMNENGH